MKAALGMPKGMTGIYITKTEPMFEASRVLRAGDVLTTFNGEQEGSCWLGLGGLGLWWSRASHAAMCM